MLTTILSGGLIGLIFEIGRASCRKECCGWGGCGGGGGGF